MVSRLDIQSLSMTIYNNLNKIIEDASVSAGDLENYSELRNALLSDAGFKNTIRVGVQEADGDTIALEEHIRTAREADLTEQLVSANHILSEIISDRMPRFPELTNGYKPSADFSIAKLKELQAEDRVVGRDEFAVELTNLNPRFAQVFENIDASDGWFRDDEIVGEIEAALNDNSSTALNTLVAAAGNDAAMDSLIAATASEAGRESFSYVLEQATPDAPPPVNQQAVDNLESVLVRGFSSAHGDPANVALRAQIADAVEARREAEAAPAEPEAPELSREEMIANALDGMSREEIRGALATAHDIDENGDGGADYATYKASFIALEPAYEDFFIGIESQEGALEINPAQELLVGALNDPESSVLDNMVLMADNAEQLAALTAMVTDDGSDAHFIADERQMSDLIHSLARENGLDVHTDRYGMSVIPEGGFDIEGPAVVDGVETFRATVQTEVETRLNAPEVIVPEGTELPDTIPDKNITYVTPEGLIVPSKPETFEAPALDDPPSPPTVTVPFVGASANVNAAPVVDPNQMPIYEIQAGDNLWDIAKEQYELTSGADIMRAVDHIAKANGLTNGVDANHIDVGQELNMPSAEQIKLDVDSLDWKALDADVAANRGAAYALPDRAAAAPMMN